MTRDDIIKMAKEAKLPYEYDTGRLLHLKEVERFAELIVRECANVLRAESERLYKLSAEEKDELFASNFEICAEKCVDNEVAIKEHFGVDRARGEQ
jgi:hypothetical protein